jgi:hypothetical protein
MTTPPLQEKTLRDDFAAHALVGILAYSPSVDLNKDAKELAEFAYEIADAMLVARAQPA